MRVLVVEDDDFLNYTLSEALTEEGLIVDSAKDGEEAENIVSVNEYDIIILDLGLPKKDGLSLLNSWRNKKINTPILILTARSSWHEKVKGLNLGADDYLTKPFITEEVIARVRALIRRSSGESSNEISSGNVVIDTKSKIVSLNKKPVALTSHEYLLLEYLMINKGKIASRGKLSDHIYKDTTLNESNTIDVFITRLRRKLGRNLITTVRGLGYKIG